MSNISHFAEPKPAASVVLVRDGENALEVLMIERAKTMKFAPGAFVFPGGKVDDADADEAIWDELTNDTTLVKDVPYRIAALRELYEEASVLITECGEAGSDVPIEFRAKLEAEGLRLDVSSMVPFAHWVTPEPMPRRFDTYFYLVAHNGQKVQHDGNEAISYKWVSPHKLLHDWENDRVPLMFPTRLNLMKLARAGSVAEAMEQANNSPVVKTLPVIAQSPEGIRLTIDPACGFDVTEATERELRVETTK